MGNTPSRRQSRLQVEPLDEPREETKNEEPEDPHSENAQKNVGYIMDCSDTERQWNESHPPEGEGKEEQPEDHHEPQIICKLCAEKKTLDECYALETCGHRFCFECLKEFLADNLDVSTDTLPLCPRGQCEAPISIGDLRKALDTFRAEPEEPEEIMDLRVSAIRQSAGVFSVDLTASLEMFVDQMEFLVKCPRCKVLFERVPVDRSDPRLTNSSVQDEKGKPLEGPALLHFLENRFRCQNCQNVFCAQCQMAPYHLGYTCRSYLESLCKTHCRYCQDPLPPGSDPYQQSNVEESWVKRWKRRRQQMRAEMSVEIPLDDKKAVDEFIAERARAREAAGQFYVCSQAECQKLVTEACLSTTPCGHLCGGVRGEAEHLPCLKEDCRPAGHTNGEDYCNICWVEDLASQPSVDIGCGHIFHYKCIKERVSQGFPTPYISFSHIECPLCHKRINHPQVSLGEMPALELAMRRQGVQRLALEGLLEDPALQEGGEFHGRNEDYAIHKMAFYKCDRCIRPFYGGLKACDPGAGDAEIREVDRAEKVCNNCAGVNNNCAKHGTEYLAYKCRFCCAPSTFFCGGKAHFCTPCHDIAGQKVDFSDWSTLWSGVVACPGPENCPLEGLHPPNGEEACLGCTMCDAEQ